MTYEGLQQLWLQSTESVHKVPWQPRTCVVILWPSFFEASIYLFLRALKIIFFSRNYLTFCLRLWTEIGISWESPEHVQYVEPPVCTQQPLSVHRGKQRHPVVVGPQHNMFLQTKSLGRVGQQLQQSSALRRLLWSCLYAIQQASAEQMNASKWYQSSPFEHCAM